MPLPHDPEWDPLLSEYSLSTSPFPACPPTSYYDFYHPVVTSPDSAQGADGIPYSAWRVCPHITSLALQDQFKCILHRTASSPLQSLVFIPNADQGDYADNYRPLGTAYSKFSQCLLGSLPPAQALLNIFREPQFNYLDVQHFLDNATHRHKLRFLFQVVKQRLWL